VLGPHLGLATTGSGQDGLGRVTGLRVRGAHTRKRERALGLLFIRLWAAPYLIQAVIMKGPQMWLRRLCMGSLSMGSGI
jgi:hypothetical protein